MNAVFGDTFYFIALINDDDACHTKALDAACEQGRRFVTTAWVLTEVADAMARPQNRSSFLDLLDDLVNEARVTIIPPTQELFDKGVELYAERSDKDWSLTDCVSFVVMRELGVTEALTGDRHFEQAGFTALLV